MSLCLLIAINSAFHLLIAKKSGWFVADVGCWLLWLVEAVAVQYDNMISTQNRGLFLK